MKVHHKSRIRWSYVIAIAVALTPWFHSAVTAQETEHLLPACVQRHLNSGTAAIGWVDLTALDVEALQAFRSRFSGISDSMDSQKAVVEALVRLGVKRVYWVSDLSGLVMGPRAVLVPVPADRKDAVHGILQVIVSKSMPVEAKGVTVIQDDVILAGEHAAIEQLTSPQDGAVSSDLLAAVAVSSGPHGLVITTPVQVMLPVVALLPKMAKTTPQTTEEISEYLVSLKTFTISGDLPPSDVTVRISTKSSAVAEGLSKLVNAWTNEQLHDKAASIQLTHLENDLVLHLSSDEEAMKALAAVQLLTFGSVDQTVFNSIKQIALAMHNFQYSYGCFPPQALVNAEGKKLLSWRVLILPYLDQSALYNEFHLNEPWDSEHNSRLIARMPDVFRSAPSALSHGTAPGKTRFVAPLTESSVFGRRGPGIGISEITDGTSNTLMIVHVDDDRAVIWTKPEDVVIAAETPFDSILKADSTQFAVGMCDGSARIISRATPATVLKSMLSLNGGEIFNWDDVK